MGKILWWIFIGWWFAPIKAAFTYKPKKHTGGKPIAPFLGQDDDSLESFGLTSTEFEFERSETYKARLDHLRNKQKEMIQNKTAVYIPDDFTFNNNKAQGKAFLTKIAKLMLRAFNNECDNLVNAVTYSNYGTKQGQMYRSYDAINKLSHHNLLHISQKYLDLKIKELEVAYQYKAKIEEEKEILREEREKQREEIKARKEIEAKQKVLDKEILKLEATKERLSTVLETAQESEIAHLREELAKLEEMITQLEDDKQELDYRIENTGAGYVYIISNIGSFGERVFKIGVTRRLDPYERVAELSSASVPFRFDVHAMIFSYDAYGLESELHNHFGKNRINKVNRRKEFFSVELEEIKKLLDEHKELTFDYVVDPLAEEYHQSLQITD